MINKHPDYNKKQYIRTLRALDKTCRELCPEENKWYFLKEGINWNILIEFNWVTKLFRFYRIAKNC